MIRLAGFLIIMLGSCGCGFSLVRERKEYLERCRAWEELLERMEHEIAFQKSSLPEICGRLSAHLSGRQRLFLEQVGRAFAENCGDTLGEVWKRELSCVLQEEPLKKELQREMESLGEKLCCEDSDMQRKMLRDTGEFVRKHLEEQERADREKNRLTLCAGVMGGLLLTVLLL